MMAASHFSPRESTICLSTTPCAEVREVSVDWQLWDKVKQKNHRDIEKRRQRRRKQRENKAVRMAMEDYVTSLVDRQVVEETPMPEVAPPAAPCLILPRPFFRPPPGLEGPMYVKPSRDYSDCCRLSDTSSSHGSASATMELPTLW
eukprot:TRINITY_DN35632_c0_g1_i1.p1 TRINITY_DN35632_c0_g1~~TRINITY_DN35632_c0_g1_i1.p1  ORF type:complete len:146 (-),score=23.51 TRINITY_DN35632_c0_g1_i1:706-1143(-)